MPGSAGVPESIVSDTLIAPYNNIEVVEELFEANQGSIAGIIIEPVPGNMGVVLPERNFLKQLRDLCYKNEALLIMDEVMSGFRERFGGAQHYYEVEGDITCLGKIIGGGLPVGAYGGKREIMEMVAPIGPVYQAGTLSGNPLAMASGIAMLTNLKNNNNLYSRINNYTNKLAETIQNIAANKGIPIQVNFFGSMMTPFFTSQKIKDYDSAKASDDKVYAKVFWRLLESGIYPPPSQFEAWFISAAMNEANFEFTANAFEKALS
jgi:glutamate-1-semialdehyde 2,1-aminomutase